jgi:hypothetical protein
MEKDIPTHVAFQHFKPNWDDLVSRFIERLSHPLSLDRSKLPPLDVDGLLEPRLYHLFLTLELCGIQLGMEMAHSMLERILIETHWKNASFLKEKSSGSGCVDVVVRLVQSWSGYYPMLYK